MIAAFMLNVPATSGLSHLRLRKINRGKTTVFIPKKILFWLLACLIFSAASHAEEPKAVIGYVMKAEGEAFVTLDGITQPAVIGLPLQVGSSLRTGTEGSMGVTLADNTVMSFGPNTEVSLDAFLYKPDQGDLKLSTRISRGTLNFISGVIAKLKPEAVEINTPTGTIGVRGTHFLVKVDS